MSGGTGWRGRLTRSKCGLTTKNLAYLKEARRLNPCQARWALFLFMFCLHSDLPSWHQERQGRFLVPSVLSRLLRHGARNHTPGGLRPSTRSLGSPGGRQRGPLRRSSAPETPADRHYVPQSQRAKVLEWAHSARTSGHPGVRGYS